MTTEEILKAKRRIDRMSQFAMCRLYRLAPIGHPFFDSRNKEVRDHWELRWKERGCFTPAISKALHE